jgi:hypothetical protein
MSNLHANLLPGTKVIHVHPVAKLPVIHSRYLQKITANARREMNLVGARFDDQIIWRYFPEEVVDDFLVRQGQQPMIAPLIFAYISEWATAEIAKHDRVHDGGAMLIDSDSMSMAAIVVPRLSAFPSIHSFAFVEVKGILRYLDAGRDFKANIGQVAVVADPDIDVNCWMYATVPLRPLKYLWELECKNFNESSGESFCTAAWERMSYDKRLEFAKSVIGQMVPPTVQELYDRLAVKKELFWHHLSYEEQVSASQCLRRHGFTFMKVQPVVFRTDASGHGE